MTATDPRYRRLVGQALILPTLPEETEFGFWQALIAPGMSFIQQGVQSYTQIKTSEQAAKAAKAEAEAAVLIAQAQAKQRSESMRMLAPMLGIAVVGGLLVTVLALKKRG